MKAIRSPKANALVSPVFAEKNGATEDLLKPLLEQEDCDKTEQASPIRIAVLGCGDSGKSTLCRQIRFLADGDLPEGEKDGCGSIASQNLLSGVAQVLESLNPETLPRNIRGSAETVLKAADLEFMLGYYRPELVDALTAVLNDTVFRVEFQRALDAHEVHPSCGVFAERFLQTPSWGTRRYKPTTEDILGINVRTSGVIAHKLTMGRPFEIKDTGGQRCERRKWVHAHHKANAIIFVASMADYDDVLYEAPEQNRLAESLQLFETVANDPNLKDKKLFLILTKEDDFRQKLQGKGIPLNVSGRFPTAPTGNDPIVAANWMQEQFLQRRRDASRLIGVRRLNAKSLDDVRSVMNMVQASFSTN